MVNLRFNKMIKDDLGWFINTFSLNGVGKVSIVYDEDSQPVSKEQIKQRFLQYKINNGIASNPEEFSLVVSLPVYQKRLT